jgi:hypothetical protein
MRYGTIVLSIFIRRLGLVDPDVHPLMQRTLEKPLRAWNTAFIWFTLNSESDQQWDMPNWLNNQERLRFLWSPKWMRSNIEYQGPTGELLAFPHFTWPMDGELRTEEYHFFDGVVIWKYAGRWEEL